MASYCLLITSGPQTANQSRAFDRALTLLSRGNEVTGVFFYSDGTLSANDLICLAADEARISVDWTRLSKEHNVPLVCCASAANRRGVIGKEEAEYHNKTCSNLKTEFVLGGLGEFIALSECSDHVEQY